MSATLRVLRVALGVILALVLYAVLVSAQRTAVPRTPEADTPPAPAPATEDRKPPDTKAEPRTPDRTPPPDQRAEPRSPERKPPDDNQRTAQRRPPAPRPPAPRPAEPHRTVAVRGEVIFIGGYFYDPYYGPYPWWPRPVHRPWYFPVYDYRAELRLRVTPRDAAVYVDGYFAGIVDDFDGMFQKLLLPPGGHTIATFRDGYQTEQRNLYLRPGSSMTIRYAMAPLPPGYRSEPPAVMAPVAPPPPGSYRLPPGASPVPPAPPIEIPPTAAVADGFGTLELRVQPADANVTIDGQPWTSSEPGHLVVDVGAGRRHVTVSKAGYQGYARDVEVAEGQTTPVNVSLAPERP